MNLPLVPHFKNQELLIRALTHRSVINEKKSLKKSNERLEFLGDAVIQLWCSEKIFRLFPDFPEGQLTNLRSATVRTEALAEAAQKLNLGSYLLLSRGEEKNHGREKDSLLADTFEALIGALYLDQRYPAVDRLLTKYLLPKIKSASAQKTLKDHKSLLQEHTQAKFNLTPHYRLISSTGPEHQKNFKIGVYLNKKLLGTGESHSKQKAEEQAAEKALSSSSS